MAVTARTWVEGEIATAAKFNTIRDDILELNLIAGINSVQHGTITMNTGVTSATSAINTVNINKTVLHHLGATIGIGAGSQDGAVRIDLLSSTSVRARRSQSSDQCVVGFCVEEHK